MLSLSQIRSLSKKIFKNIYDKVNKKNLNYYQINENNIEEIMRDLELTKPEEKMQQIHIKDLNLFSVINTNTTIKTENSIKSTYRNTSVKDETLPNECTQIEYNNILFDNENAFENLFFLNNQNEMSNNEERFLFNENNENNTDLFRFREDSTLFKELNFN